MTFSFKKTKVEFRNEFSNPLSKSFNAINADITSINSSEDRNRELPIIDSLISRTTLIANETDSRDRISLGGASSMGELQWENDMMMGVGLGVGDDTIEHNGNELEWDNYEEDNIALHMETEQLILEIEEMTKTSSNQLRQ